MCPPWPPALQQQQALQGLGQPGLGNLGAAGLQGGQQQNQLLLQQALLSQQLQNQALISRAQQQQAAAQQQLQNQLLQNQINSLSLQQAGLGGLAGAGGMRPGGLGGLGGAGAGAGGVNPAVAAALLNGGLQGGQNLAALQQVSAWSSSSRLLLGSSSVAAGDRRAPASAASPPLAASYLIAMPPWPDGACCPLLLAPCLPQVQNAQLLNQALRGGQLGGGMPAARNPQAQLQSEALIAMQRQQALQAQGRHTGRRERPSCSCLLGAGGALAHVLPARRSCRGTRKAASKLMRRRPARGPPPPAAAGARAPTIGAGGSAGLSPDQLAQLAQLGFLGKQAPAPQNAGLGITPQQQAALLTALQVGPPSPFASSCPPPASWMRRAVAAALQHQAAAAAEAQGWALTPARASLVGAGHPGPSGPAAPRDPAWPRPRLLLPQRHCRRQAAGPADRRAAGEGPT